MNDTRQRDGLRILLMNWRDPKHPQAGGAETYLFEQAKLWTKWGHHVEWLTAGFPGGSRRETLDSIDIHRVGNALTVYFVIPWTYLREYRGRFDVIVDAENGLPFFAPTYAKIPVICVMHHVHREVFRNHLPAFAAYPLIWCEEKLMPFVYRNARFVAVSEDTREEMRRIGVNADTIGLVRNGVSGDLVPGTKSPVPTVLYLGRLKAYKRVDLLIDAFSRVRNAVPAAVLRVAGTGDTVATLRALVRDRGLDDAVTFEGFVDERRKRELLQEAWVLVTPSEMEGWGITVIEANACGTPAVAFAVPGLREAIAGDVSGILVPEGADLAPSITSILTQPALRNRLESGAISRAGDFSWEQSARGMLREIEGVIR